MREYIIALVSVSLIASIASFMVTESMKKQVGLVCALCILCVTLSPTIDIINWLGEIKLEEPPILEGEEYESIFDASISEFDQGRTEAAICEVLNKKFGILREDCRVSVTLSADRDGVERIFVRLYGDGVWADTRKIEEYFEGLFGCEVVTAIG